MADVPAEIRTEHLPNATPERHRYANPFRVQVCFMTSLYAKLQVPSANGSISYRHQSSGG
jgi:hypothetical protein